MPAPLLRSPTLPPSGPFDDQIATDSLDGDGGRSEEQRLHETPRVALDVSVSSAGFGSGIFGSGSGTGDGITGSVPGSGSGIVGVCVGSGSGMIGSGADDVAEFMPGDTRFHEIAFPLLTAATECYRWCLTLAVTLIDGCSVRTE